MVKASRPRVLVVEDDRTVLTVVGDYLRQAGYRVAGHTDGARALAALRDRVPDVLILDRMLPGVSGDELCREARAMAQHLPILMLTALDRVDDRIEGLEHGADDYLAKPFALRELVLRVNAMVRRASSAPAVSFVAGPFGVDPVRRRVSVAGRDVPLTGREYELLVYLLQNAGRTVTRDKIMREVLGWSHGDPSTVTVHIRRLREKIEPEPHDPRHLLTVWGEGYRFIAEEGRA
ncbi:DNA-binding response regulator [Leifsonia sp. ku-ls]|nr:DNA-binding response regulator [Leifsonia sp. ku-ls]